MDRMDLFERYFDLYQFICLFNEVAYPGLLLDEKVVAGDYFDTRYKPDAFAKVREQAAELFALSDFPVMAITDSCQKHFNGADDCRRWLEKVLDLMEQRVRAENPTV